MTVPLRRISRLHPSAAALVCAVVAACHTSRSGPPTADFLLFTADSTFWIHSGPQGVHARGSPIQLARYGGKFYEVYVADDDRSYTNAEIVGQQVWRRDIVSGDSSLVFRDTTIEGIERWYTRTHPHDQPVDPDDDSDDNDPRVSATSELDLLDQFGPYVSYEYRADLTLDAGDEWHIARRGVLDLRRARDASVHDLFGDTAQTLIAKGRTLFGQALDSVLMSHDTRAREAADVIGDFAFDSGSYNLIQRGGRPAVEFVSPGRGTRGGGLTLALPPITAGAPSWWNLKEAGLPDSSDAATQKWRSGVLQVVTRSTAGGDSARIELVDSARHVWNVGEVEGQVQRLYWLNKSSTDTATLRALARAFDEAALYSDEARTAMTNVPPEPHAARPHLASREGRPVRASQHETSEIMMPQHANVLGHVFGGVILSMMDKTAAVAAIRHARGNCVTVSVDRVDFREPIHVGDLVVMHASVNYAGRTSMEVGVRVEAENLISGVRRHTNSCYVTFVAIDRNGRPVEVPQVIPETEIERRRYAAAVERRRRRLEERAAEETGRGSVSG